MFAGNGVWSFSYVRVAQVEAHSQIEFGANDAVQANLRSQALQLREDADRIWKITTLGDSCRVLPNLLHCTARQLEILASSMSMPIEVSAGACRTIFEANVWARLVTSNEEKLQDFQTERVFDEISFLEAFKRLAHEDTPPATLTPISDRIEYLLNFAQKRQSTKSKTQTVAERSKTASVEAEYRTLYAFYSKYVHASSWLVNTRDEERDGPAYRNILLVQAQRYAGNTRLTTDEFVKKETKTSP